MKTVTCFWYYIWGGGGGGGGSLFAESVDDVNWRLELFSSNVIFAEPTNTQQDWSRVIHHLYTPCTCTPQGTQLNSVHHSSRSAGASSGDSQTGGCLFVPLCMATCEI